MPMTEEERRQSHNARNRAYRLRNLEKVTAKNKAWYEANREYANAKGKQWRAENPERAKQLKRNWLSKNKDWANFTAFCRRFNISREFGALLQLAETCQICDEGPPPGKKLVLDHNHATNQLRGMLCDRCNKTLGLAKDSVELLYKMAQYLEKTGKSNV